MLSKSDLVKIVAEKAHMTNSEAERSIDSFLEAIKENINDKVQIRDFGTFSINKLSARVGRNPQTGESVDIPEKNRVHFKPSKAFKDSVN